MTTNVESVIHKVILSKKILLFLNIKFYLLLNLSSNKLHKLNMSALYSSQKPFLTERKK